MAGDPLQPVTEGQRFDGIPTRLYNPMARSVRDYQSDTLLTASIGGKSPEGLIYVQNNSGSLVNRFGVLGLAGVIINDSTNLPEFQNKWALSGTTPTAAYSGKFAVAWEPIAAGAIGRAFISGTCPCQVQMANTTDPCADILPSDVTQLQSGGMGSAQILFCGSPISSGSSTYWCIIRLSAGAVIPRVRPTATLPGRGWYSGFLVPNGAGTGLTPGTTGSPVDLTPSMFNAAYTGGSIPSGTTACYIANIREAWLGTSGTHMLDISADASSIYGPKTFLGVYLGPSQDSAAMPVYLIDGVQDELACGGS